MVHKVVCLLVLFGVASSHIPHGRICDPEPPRVTPTRCSNYNNIVYLDDSQTRLEVKQRMLQQKIDAMEAQLNATTTALEAKLKRIQDAPRVAFSASLIKSGQIYRGPSSQKRLVYKRIFSNTGGYNQNTGIFTAPVKGLYFFTFSTYGYNTHVMGAILMKNGARQISTYDYPTVDGSDMSSNSAILQLATGDRVYMELWHNGRVYDNWNGHTTFSGFLVYPV